MRAINFILLLLGSALLTLLVWSIGVGELWAELRSLGWGLIPFFMIEGIAEMIHTLGWRHCLSGEARSLSWFELFPIRLAGYAINYLTPTAALGGEVSKATLLASKCPGREAVSGVLIGKACFGLAHVIFVAIGAVAILRGIHLPSAIWMPLLFSALLIGGGVLTFILLQKHGKLGAVIRWFTRRRMGGRALESVAAHLTAVDEELRAFYRDRPVDMCLAICWHLVGYSTGILQTWFFLHLLHPPALLSVAAAIWFLGMWFDLLTFAIPMNVGALEGSRILSLKLFGFGSVLGLAYGIALRLAQIFWATIGLAFYSVLTVRRPAQAPNPRTTDADKQSAAGPSRVDHGAMPPVRPWSMGQGFTAPRRTNLKPNGHQTEAGPNGHNSNTTGKFENPLSREKAKADNNTKE